MAARSYINGATTTTTTLTVNIVRIPERRERLLQINILAHCINTGNYKPVPILHIHPVIDRENLILKLSYLYTGMLLNIRCNLVLLLHKGGGVDETEGVICMYATTCAAN